MSASTLLLSDTKKPPLIPLSLLILSQQKRINLLSDNWEKIPTWDLQSEALVYSYQ